MLFRKFVVCRNLSNDELPEYILFVSELYSKKEIIELLTLNGYEPIFLKMKLNWFEKKRLVEKSITKKLGIDDPLTSFGDDSLDIMFNLKKGKKSKKRKDVVQ